MKKKMMSLALLASAGLVSVASFAQTAPSCPAPSVIKSAHYLGGSPMQELFTAADNHIIQVNAASESAAKSMVAKVTGSYSVKYVKGNHYNYYYCSYAPYTDVTIDPTSSHSQLPPFVTYYFIKAGSASKIK